MGVPGCAFGGGVAHDAVESGTFGGRAGGPQCRQRLCVGGFQSPHNGPAQVRSRRVAVWRPSEVLRLRRWAQCPKGVSCACQGAGRPSHARVQRDVRLPVSFASQALFAPRPLIVSRRVPPAIRGEVGPLSVLVAAQEPGPHPDGGGLRHTGRLRTAARAAERVAARGAALAKPLGLSVERSGWAVER